MVGQAVPSVFISSVSPQFGGKRQGRARAAGLALALHVTALSLILFGRPIAAVSAEPGLATFAVPAGAAPAAAAAPPRPAPPKVVPIPPLPASVLQVARIDVLRNLAEASPIGDAAAMTTPAAIGNGCDLTPQVQDALRRSDDVRHRLADVPSPGPAATTAVVVWNAGWIGGGAGPAQAALAAIRQTIERSVAASSADCRGQRQTGPRFLYLPVNPGRTTVLAVGSGEWSWQWLATGSGEPGPAPGAGPTPVPAAPAPTAVSRPPMPDPAPALNAMLASLIGRRSPVAGPYYP